MDRQPIRPIAIANSLGFGSGLRIVSRRDPKCKDRHQAELPDKTKGDPFLQEETAKRPSA